MTDLRTQSNFVKETAVSRGWSPFLFDVDKFNYEQLLEIFAGHLAGVDVLQYAQPKISADEMSVIRERLSEEIGYEPTPEDISDLDSVCPERLFLKDMAEMITMMADNVAAMKLDLSHANILTAAKASIELNEEALKKMTIELYVSEGHAQVTAGKYTYQYDLKISGEVALLSSLRFIGLTVKMTTPGLIII